MTPTPECEACADTGEVRAERGPEGVQGVPCTECCPHDEHDHFICLNCGHEGEPSDYYDEDALKD